MGFGKQLFAHSSAGGGGNLSASGRGKEKESPAQLWERLVMGVMEGKNARGKVGAMRVLVGVRERRGGRVEGVVAYLGGVVGG